METIVGFFVCFVVKEIITLYVRFTDHNSGD
jgi:hypothetical protein